MNIIQAKVGAARRVKLTLSAGTYSGAEALSAAVWPGDDLALVWSPAVEWLDPGARTVKLSWEGTATVGLAPGRYPLEVQIGSGAAAVKLDVGVVELLASSGTGVARPVYCTWDDVRRYAGSWVEPLGQGKAGQSGAAEERADAREAFEEILHARYGSRGGWLSGDRLSLGSGLLPRSPWLAEQLAADRLVVTEPVRRWNVLWTLYRICQRQVGSQGDKTFAARAAAYRDEADGLLPTLLVELDTDGDGVGDVPIVMGSIRLLRG